MDIQIFSIVRDFFENLPQDDAAKVIAHIKSLGLEYTEGLTIKPLKGKVQELIVRQYRIVFFRIGNTGYVVDAFRKQSKKTPSRIIERAEKIYRNITT